MVTLAQLMLEAIEKQNVLQQDLARSLYISPASITKWTRAEYRDPIPWRHWRAICTFLHIPWSTWIKVARKDVPRHVEQYERFMRLAGK